MISLSGPTTGALSDQKMDSYNTSLNVSRVKVPCDEVNRPGDEWWIFLLSSVAAPAVIGTLVLLCEIFAYLSDCFSKSKSTLLDQEGSSNRPVPDTLHRTDERRSRSLFRQLQIRAQHLMSTTNPWGQLLNFLVFAASMAVYAIYLTEVSYRNPACRHKATDCLESCYQGSIYEDFVSMLEFGLNCFFIFQFLIRFTASHQKFWFLVDLYAIVDYCTIPPAFVGVYLHRSWTGLRFVRVLHLLSVPEFLQYMQLLRTRTSMRFCQLICTICSVLLTAAGIFHLLENSTDLFNEAEVGRDKSLSYWEYVYFCIVTAGTVGYGDIKCITSQGRIFNAIFILSTLAVVASILPDIFRIIANRKKYGGQYSEHGGKKHIVVCGNINFISAGGFLKEFLHKDRGSCDIKVIFMDLKEPDIEMEGLLKRHFTDVEYLQGSAMHSNDLKRAKTHECEACIIVANKYCVDPDAEDAANIMRVISIKNYNSSTRVIVELMQYHNKAYLLNIPSWNWKNGDEVVCLAELKLGLIAQSCIAPGFSTLMANLFTSRSFSSSDKVTSIDSYEGWKAEYLQGTGMEMYSEILSSAFIGLTFAQTAEICLLKLDILLLAVSFWDPQMEDYSMDINPKPTLIMEPKTQGFFIADSALDVQRAASYCDLCHTNIHRIDLIKKCGCRPNANSRIKVVTQVMSKPNSPRNSSDKSGRKMSVARTKEEKVEIFIQNYPSTPTMKRAYELLEPHPGTFLVVPLTNKYKSLSESSESGGEVSLHIADPEPDLAALTEQIENCKFDSTGMFHWCAPRPFESALIDRYAAAKKQFQGHVVVGIFADANSPLIGLNSLVMPLRSSNFNYEELKQIVFLGNIDYLQREWKNLYNFPKIVIAKGTALSRADLRALSIHSCSMCVILTAKVPHSNDANLTDKEVIMASLNIKAMDCEPRVISRATGSWPSSSLGGVSRRGSQVTIQRKYRLGARIPMITDLFNDPNVQFLDPDDDDDDPDTGFFATEPFACGTAFTASVLDSLMSMVYFNPSAFRVIRALIFGGASSELEEILAEGAGLIGGAQLSDADNRNRSYITQIRLTDALFLEFANQTFGELFVSVLRNYGILCLGIFRLFSETNVTGGSSSKRYVITKPAPNNRLRESDHIFALMQSDFGGASAKELVVHNNSS